MKRVTKQIFWTIIGSGLISSLLIGAATAKTLSSASTAGPMQLAQAQQNGISKSQAADIAKAAYGGKVLKVEETSQGGQKVYRVKLLLSEGRIKIVTVNGRSGNVY